MPIVPAILLLLVAAFPGFADEYRVAPGDDVHARFAKLAPGDTLLVSSGEYTVGWTISGLKGAAGKPITIRGEPGAVIRPAKEREGILLWNGSEHVVIESLRVEKAKRAGIIVGSSRHVVVRNCVLADNGVWGVQTCLSDFVTVEDCETSGSELEHGIYFSTTDHPVARRCRVHDNASCGIHMNGDKSEGGDGVITGAAIEDNVIWNNGAKGGAGINMDGVEKSRVSGNILYNNTAGGIVSFHQDGIRTGSGNVFSNNIVWFRPGQGRFALGLSGGGRDTVLIGNVLVCGRGPALDIDGDSTKGLKSDRNVFFVHGGSLPVRNGFLPVSLKKWRERSGCDAASSETVPKYADPEKGDFREIEN